MTLLQVAVLALIATTVLAFIYWVFFHSADPRPAPSACDECKTFMGSGGYCEEHAPRRGEGA